MQTKSISYTFKFDVVDALRLIENARMLMTCHIISPIKALAMAHCADILIKIKNDDC